ncbi:MAG: hypothetical protein ABI629_13845, partial [bacterium]
FLANWNKQVSSRHHLSIVTHRSSLPVRLADYYFGTPGVVLVPIEHLTPNGLSAAFAAAAGERAGWSAAQVALFDAAFARYWQRSTDLARRTPTWAPPRCRHVAVLADGRIAHPYVQLLNTSAWTLYASDLDPARSDPEFLAYLLAHGDRMALSGEVTLAALRNAAWWLERDDDACAAFERAAQHSTRPDADAFRLLAAALPWLRRLDHVGLRPTTDRGARAIADTGVLVPAALAAEPPRLVDGWTRVARRAVAEHAVHWQAPDPDAVPELCVWLTSTAPPLLITARPNRIVWDPAEPARLGALRGELKRCAGAALRDVRADLLVAVDKTRRCLAALTDPRSLPPVGEAEQGGYVYMHQSRGLLAYNLDEPGTERRNAPALPFAHAMLGARAVHEWAHRAVDAGAVPRCVDTEEYDRRQAILATQLEEVIAAAPAAIRATAQADLDALCASEACPPGTALARLIGRRMDDWRANLFAQPLLDEAERESYVRQNVRTLRGEYPPARRWRLLIRYLYEYQYLRFSAVEDRRGFFFTSTWFDADFLATGILDAARFDTLAAAVTALCDCYAPRPLQ